MISSRDCASVTGRCSLVLSGSCCEGSSPLCLHEDELPIGPNDLCLGEVGRVPFYIQAEQYHRWNEPTLQLDIAPGESDTFSLENSDRLHFIARSNAYTAPSPSR